MLGPAREHAREGPRVRQYLRFRQRDVPAMAGEERLEFARIENVAALARVAMRSHEVVEASTRTRGGR